MGHSLLARDKLNHMWTKSFNTRTSCIFWQHQHADLCNYLHIFGLSSYDCTPFCSQLGVGLTGQFRDWWAYVEKILALTVSIRAEFWMVSKFDKNDIMSSMIFFQGNTPQPRNVGNFIHAPIPNVIIYPRADFNETQWNGCNVIHDLQDMLWLGVLMRYIISPCTY